MNLSAILASSRAWDAHSAEPGMGLLADLQRQAPAPLRDARLAYLLLMLGRLEEAQGVLNAAEPQPLVQAVQLAIWVEQHRFAEVLATAPQSLDSLPAPLHAEARARLWLEQSKANFHLSQYRQAAALARQAEARAADAGMGSLALVCRLHAEECEGSLDETGLELAEREAYLREQASAAPAQESRVMAYLALVRLLARQGLYDKAMRFTLEVPRPLNGRHFVELMLVLNHLDDQSDWGRLDARYQGRLHAIKGLLGLDAEFILGGPPPDPSFHPRPHAEWNLAFGWARLSRGEFAAALEHFQAAFIPRCEWDIRVVRDMGLIELSLLAPEQLQEYSLEQLVQETHALLTQRIHPQSLILRLLPRGMPHATALLLALPEPCAALGESAQGQQLWVNPAGLTIAGVTHPNTTALVKLLEGQTEGMSAGALRTNRHRLGLFVRQFGNPVVVRGSVVWAAIGRLCESAEEAGRWREVRRRYAEAFSYAE
ncbi:MAG: hypothetical protein SFU83_21850 [Meiothermus sp.]|nr:hypothetical protein [Meiothermus sp.]